jgi:hypothetical protein
MLAAICASPDTDVGEDNKGAIGADGEGAIDAVDAVDAVVVKVETEPVWLPEEDRRPRSMWEDFEKSEPAPEDGKFHDQGDAEWVVIGGDPDLTRFCFFVQKDSNL